MSAGRGARRSPSPCVRRSRRLSGGIRMARNGAAYRPIWCPGGGRRRPSSAGATWVSGNGFSNAFRQFIWDQGARPAIPAKSNEAPVACPSWIYNNRNRVERLWARLKEWRAVATRYEKTARSFIGVLCLAAVFDWIKKDFKL